MNLLLVIHIFSCYLMTGVIWLVQVLIYPNFRLLDESGFKDYHHFHLTRITWIVAPVMALELLTGALLAWFHSSIFLLNLTLIGFLWIWTGVINVPSHNRLDFKAVQSKRSLVTKNWPRTLVWTLRSLFLTWFLFQTLEGRI